MTDKEWAVSNLTEAIDTLQMAWNHTIHAEGTLRGSTVGRDLIHAESSIHGIIGLLQDTLAYITEHL